MPWIKMISKAMSYLLM